MQPTYDEAPCLDTALQHTCLTTACWLLSTHVHNIHATLRVCRALQRTVSSWRTVSSHRSMPADLARNGLADAEPASCCGALSPASAALLSVMVHQHVLQWCGAGRLRQACWRAQGVLPPRLRTRLRTVRRGGAVPRATATGACFGMQAPRRRGGCERASRTCCWEAELVGAVVSGGPPLYLNLCKFVLPVPSVTLASHAPAWSSFCPAWPPGGWHPSLPSKVRGLFFLFFVRGRKEKH